MNPTKSKKISLNAVLKQPFFICHSYSVRRALAMEKYIKKYTAAINLIKGNAPQNRARLLLITTHRLSRDNQMCDIKSTISLKDCVRFE